MSASARDYVYKVAIKDPKKPEPAISKRELEESKKRVAQYLQKDNAKKV